jgi:hypothetical protein
MVPVPAPVVPRIDGIMNYWTIPAGSLHAGEASQGLKEDSSGQTE